ncbi:MAG: type VI secretion system baseplate subunit TssG [Pikeienuella sp.]
MDSEERNAPVDLMRLAGLAADPKRYHVLKALRLIEAAYPDRPRFGRSRRPNRDPVRLGQNPELAFATSTVDSFALGGADQPARLSAHFFGLWGPHGALPLHLTEYARDRFRNHHDPTLVAFGNVFHHRMMSLFYRAWASAEPAASHDRPDDDPFGEKVAAVAGRMGAAFKHRDAMPDLVKLGFSGRLTHSARNEEGLLALVAHFFRAGVSIESFVGSWLELDHRDRFAFPGPRPVAQLGRSITVGERVWSRQAKFRIRIGPLTLDAYNRLLPGGESLRRLRAIVANYIGEELDWEVALVLEAAEVPALELGRQGRLGWTTWIGTRPDETDADDLMLMPQDAPTAAA